MNADRVLALIFAVLSLYFLAVMVPEVGAQEKAMGSLNFYTVGPTALPYLTGVMVLVFSVGTFLISGHHAAEQGPAFSVGLKGGLGFFAITLVYAMGMTVVGFLPASILFLAAVFGIFRVPSWRIAVPVTLVVPVLLDQILRKLFLVPLPGSCLF